MASKNIFDMDTEISKMKDADRLKEVEATNKKKREEAREKSSRDKLKGEFRTWINKNEENTQLYKKVQDQVLAFTHENYLPSTAHSLLSYDFYIESQCRLWYKYAFLKGIKTTYRKIWEEYCS